MRESRDNYIIKRMWEEDQKKEKSITEIDILKKNIADLKEQLRSSYIKQKLFLDKLNELQKRRTISLASEKKQLDFDFKSSDKK